MSIARQLARWQHAGLIDGKTAESILAFEKEQGRPLLIYALGSLGALSVSAGIISLIAANWDELGRPAKLGADLIILGAVAFGLARSRSTDWVREVLTIVYFLTVLASVALIGQTYQLGGEVHQALALWLVLATPAVVVFGRSWLLAALWLGGFGATIGTTIAYAFDTYSWLQEDEPQLIALSVVCSLVALFALWLSIFPWFVRQRAHHAGFFRSVIWFTIVASSSVAQHLWYIDFSDEYRGSVTPVPWSVLGAPALAGLLFAWYSPKTLADLSARARYVLRGVMLFAVVSSLAPCVFRHDEHPAVGAISFLLLWIGLALVAHQVGRIRLLNLATAIIALRIIIAYVEVFDTLARTGVGMIIGGGLALAILWAWVRISRDFRGEHARTHGKEGVT